LLLLTGLFGGGVSSAAAALADELQQQIKSSFP
jgi:adenylylsulfate kinase-like enzyme